MSAQQDVTSAEYHLKDSGDRTNFSTGSVRDRRKGKGRYDLLPPFALHCVARVMEVGADKYGSRNWEKGQPIAESFLDSALRHLNQVLMGKQDEDHLSAAAWNVLCALDTRERIKQGLLPKELNDLPIRVEDGVSE